jgi:type I restriction enzyme S subunit
MGELFAYDSIDPSTNMQRIQLTEKEANKYRLTQNDLLFGRRSIVMAGAGKCTTVKSEEEELVFESSILRLTLNPELILPDFVFAWLQSNRGKRCMNRIKTFTTVAGITGSALKTLPVPLPPLSEQREIIDCVRAIKSCESEIMLSEAKAASLSSSLINHLA